MTEQPKMHIDAVKAMSPARNLDLAMEHAARLRPMHGDIEIVGLDDGILAQNRIAMMAAVIDGILAIGEFVP